MSSGDRRALLVGASAVVVVLLIRFALMPIGASAVQLSHDVDRQRRLLERDRQVIAEASDPVVDARARENSFTKEIARNGDPILLQEEFEEMFRTIAAGWTVDVEGVQWLQVDQMPSGIGAMRVQLGGRSDFEGVLGFLWTIEQGAELILVESIGLNVEIPATASPAGMETIRWAATMVVYFDAGLPVPRDLRLPPSTSNAGNGISGTGDDERPDDR